MPSGLDIQAPDRLHVIYVMISGPGNLLHANPVVILRERYRLGSAQIAYPDRSDTTSLCRPVVTTAEDLHDDGVGTFAAPSDTRELCRMYYALECMAGKHLVHFQHRFNR